MVNCKGAYRERKQPSNYGDPRNAVLHFGEKEAQRSQIGFTQFIAWNRKA